ncbi:DUF4260 domain-containing protein [Paenibacillus sp. TRM 82003]|nr:DUF4260 domain-containing protein [Paenibacillus sp. TRM 82003]
MNKLFLHIEALLVLIFSIGYYGVNELNWWLFAVLFFVPDVSMVGYLFNNKIGAYLYNLFHTYTIPLLLILVGMLTRQDLILAIGLVWMAHVGMDRALGYGLKYPTAFKDTHMHRV